MRESETTREIFIGAFEHSTGTLEFVFEN